MDERLAAPSPLPARLLVYGPLGRPPGCGTNMASPMIRAAASADWGPRLVYRQASSNLAPAPQRQSATAPASSSARVEILAPGWRACPQSLEQQVRQTETEGGDRPRCLAVSVDRNGASRG